MNYEVLRHREPICSGNGRLKMAEKLKSRKLSLKTTYKGLQERSYAKNSLRTSALFSLWSPVRSVPTFSGKHYPWILNFQPLN